MTRTWVPVPERSPFPVQNLPYGVASLGAAPAFGAVAIGEHVLDLSGLDLRVGDAFARPSLNAFLALGRPTWRAVRARLTELLTDDRHRDTVEPLLHPLGEVTLHRPVDVGDYVDFYSSRHHAENLGRMFRPDGPPLTPNWTHLPIGYHGRAGTVVVSGTPVRRPCGQRRAPGEAAPSFGPSARLDIEAEVGFVVGTPSVLGEPVPADAFAEHVFGVVLVNDWSARDLQAWEGVPLGPFLGKSFATSMSAWVVPLEALEEARLEPPPQDPTPLPYLRGGEPWALDLNLTVSWNGTIVSRPPFRTMYWTAAQQLAHLTVNGASLRTGDLFASGTVSGPAKDQRGSFIELSWGGEEPVDLDDGSTRTFLEDGDTVTISASAPGRDGVRIGLGPVTGTICPAR
jgi:fumarylacetoacetase